MSSRRDIVESLRLDLAEFRDRAREDLDREWVAADRLRRTDGPTDFEGPEGVPDYRALDPEQQDLVWRMWLLDDAPVGLILSGPAYRDNPLIYANRTFRELTGYPLADLRGENPRLLQGPETGDEPVATLREAVDTWERVTVELRNYRRDGTPFRNRVSLVPVLGVSGTVTNWIGVQEAVGPEPESESASGSR